MVVQETEKHLVPHNAKIFENAFCKTVGGETVVQDRLVHGMLAASGWSVGRRLLRGVLCTMLSASTCYKLRPGSAVTNAVKHSYEDGLAVSRKCEQ